MKTKNLAIYQGDTHLFKIALTSETGEPLQTDGLSFALAVKFPDGSTITPELTVDGNIVSLMFPSALTAAITHTTAEYDLRAISGQYVKTYLRGQLHITPSITPVTAGEGGEIREEAVSVTVSEAAIIRAAGNQSQTTATSSNASPRWRAVNTATLSTTTATCNAASPSWRATKTTSTSKSPPFTAALTR